jgi:4-amino-4-deoxy-L-arabinose transferase-like glycosyltransferase
MDAASEPLVAGPAGPVVTDRDRRRAFILLAISCLILILESSILIRTRWVEDESWLASNSWAVVHEGQLRSPIFPGSPRSVVDVSPPIHPLSMAASFAVFGVGIPQARAVSAVAAVGLVIVTFFLGYEFGGPLCAGFAALLAATDTFLMIAARTARGEAETALLVWLAILLYYLATRRQSRKLALCSGLACGVGMVTHPLALPFTVCIGIFFLMRYGWGIWRQPLVWIFLCGAVLPLIPYAAWCFSDGAHIASFRDSYLAKAAEPFRGRLAGEVDRWSDFIGLSTQRVSLPVRVPVRLHIAVILVAAFAYLFRRNRNLAVPMLVLLSVNVLWWFYLVNKGPRYLVMITPIFALVLGYLLSRAREMRVRAPIVAACALVLLTQCAGNAYWIYKFRTADYPAVARQLRQIIPPGAKVYGATTFWMALHDRTYYAYDRTPFDYATRNLHPQYLILYDRVMVNGSGHGQDDFGALRTEASAFARQHGTLAGRVSNSFYGDLKIFRITY